MYFYVSHDRPRLFTAFHQLVADQGLPLHRGEPEVPYLRTLAPAVYALFGIGETYDYMATALGEDPAPLIEAGTSADDWLRGVSDAFSLVCELPYYTAPALADTTPTDRTRADAIRTGIARAEGLHQEIARAFAALAGRAPDHRLTRSVADYVRKTPKRLAAELAHAESPAYQRTATRAEALDATSCRAFYHVLYLGEVFRIAELVGDRALADELRARLTTLVSEIERESALSVLPIRPLVAVQAGAGLLALGHA